MRLVVFDCDGTLVDSQATIVFCAQEAFRACGIAPPTDEAVRRIVGLSLEPAMGVLLGTKASPTLNVRIAAAYRDAFLVYKARPEFDEPLFEGVAALLDALLARNLLLGVATGKSMPGLKRVIERHGFHRHFVTLQTADLHPSKPHPSMMHAAMRETGTLPHETMIVGDTTFDIDMGRSAGCRAVGVSYGNHPASELHAAGAEAVIDRIADLALLLQAETAP